MILEANFSILREITIQLDENLARIFYIEHSGRVVVMVLEKEDAVVDWRALIGSMDASKAKVQCIRAMCGLDMVRNCVHCSDSPQSAAREVSFFFGEVPSSGQFLSFSVHMGNYKFVCCCYPDIRFRCYCL
ncbi:hypothetical protein MKW94_022769 [Papaver nudicaule]|uniref:Nucleoside diphosphate kinase-like domain-containing protein n=1 Tax=Papaver nudicaule TaxID=74823 RepID=A0AA41VPG6_PAPNU|nr:hypothetical protein [Papaver nudicaule]